MERLKVIENNTDGFKIAEEDLRIRGEGDLFGKEQSGSESQNAWPILSCTLIFWTKHEPMLND